MLSKIKKEYSDAVQSKCCENNCGPNLSKIPNHVILNAEQLKKSDNRACDCIIFDERNTLTASLIELKSKNPKTSIVEEQFNGGLLLLQKILKKIKYKKPYNLIILLLAKNYQHSERKLLHGIILKMAGAKFKINIKECGADLNSISHIAIKP